MWVREKPGRAEVVGMMYEVGSVSVLLLHHVSVHHSRHDSRTPSVLHLLQYVVLVAYFRILVVSSSLFSDILLFAYTSDTFFSGNFCIPVSLRFIRDLRSSRSAV